jgi:hydroxymethylpyrimidine kinase / phosphomethylpyrimidine kinase / thiamine-phosphate diphosphorylase
MLLLIFLSWINTASLCSSMVSQPHQRQPPQLPIVYSIAGSDSGGGAGIQADLHAMHAMGCHGCSAITCLTAQSSCGVTGVHAPPAAFLKQQLDALLADMEPRAIKIGMLGTRELAETVGAALQAPSCRGSAQERPWVVLDPVMISTSGHKLIDDDAQAAMIQAVFPYADVLTPNKYEAEALLGRTLTTPQDVEEGARDLLAMGVKSVLIKGGHSLSERKDASASTSAATMLDPGVNATLGYAQDYFLSSIPIQGEERLCDGGVWIRTDRYDTNHTHGTGCTLSSAIASALALGHQRREMQDSPQGATSAILPIDACCLAKAYVTAGLEISMGLGKGPGPVQHTGFPSAFRHFPTIAADPAIRSSDIPAFLPMKAHSSRTVSDTRPTLGRILPIVDTVEWVEKLASTPGVTDIQLRIKDDTDPEVILERTILCQAMCQNANVRLWINDHWQAAVKAGCFGVHVGQEDLVKCMKAGGLDILRDKGMALGISTHSYAELAAAAGVKPSYISMGPVFGTSSKKVAFDPQGLAMVAKWRSLIDPDIPFVAIGGIGDAETATSVKEAGADCVAVIGAVTKADDVAAAVQQLNDAMN